MSKFIDLVFDIAQGVADITFAMTFTFGFIYIILNALSIN